MMQGCIDNYVNHKGDYDSMYVCVSCSHKPSHVIIQESIISNIFTAYTLHLRCS